MPTSSPFTCWGPRIPFVSIKKYFALCPPQNRRPERKGRGDLLLRRFLVPRWGHLSTDLDSGPGARWLVEVVAVATLQCLMRSWNSDSVSCTAVLSYCLARFAIVGLGCLKFTKYASQVLNNNSGILDASFVYIRIFFLPKRSLSQIFKAARHIRPIFYVPECKKRLSKWSVKVEFPQSSLYNGFKEYEDWNGRCKSMHKINAKT